MERATKIAAGLTAVSVLAITGCGPGKDADYDSLLDFKDHFVDQGFPCHAVDTNPRDTVPSVICDTGDRLFSWDKDDEDPLQFVMSETAGGRDHYVISDTWAITTRHNSDAEEIQASLGGEIHDSDAYTDYISALGVTIRQCDSDLEYSTYDAGYDVVTISGAHQGSSFRGGEESDVFDCLVADLPIPDHVLNEISRTRALDGTRDASWDEYDASWTYHPDSGINIQIQRTP